MNNLSNIIISIPDKKFQIKNSEIKKEGKFRVVDQSSSCSGFTDNEQKLFKDTPVIIFGDHSESLFYMETPFVVGCDGIKIIKNKTDDDLRFIYYYIKAIYRPDGKYKRHFDCIKMLPFYDYNINKQKNISKTLEILDKKIEINNKINSELESLAKTLYDYWFLQFEFPNEEGKPYKSSGGKMVYNEQLKKEIPEGWEVLKVKDLLNVITGKQDSNFATINGAYKFFTCSSEILNCDEYAFEGKAVLLAGNGDFNVKHYQGKFNAYQRTYIIEVIDKLKK